MLLRRAHRVERIIAREYRSTLVTRLLSCWEIFMNTPLTVNCDDEGAVTALNAWLKYQAPPISSSSSTLSQDNDKGQYNLSLSTIGDEDEDEDRIDVTSSLDDPIGLDLSGDGIPEFRDNVNS